MDFPPKKNYNKEASPVIYFLAVSITSTIFSEILGFRWGQLNVKGLVWGHDINGSQFIYMMSIGTKLADALVIAPS